MYVALNHRRIARVEVTIASRDRYVVVTQLNEWARRWVAAVASPSSLAALEP